MMNRKRTAADWIGLGAILLGLVIVVVALSIGLLTITSTIVALVAHFDLSQLTARLDGLVSLVSELDENNLRQFSIEKASIALTALATVMLAIATRRLHVASNRQVAADAPMLELDLQVRPSGVPAGPREKVEDYQPELDRDDRGYFAAQSLVPARYLYLRIRNVQNEPFAPAVNVAIRIQLAFEEPSARRVNHGDEEAEIRGFGDQREKTLVRVIRTRVIGPSCVEVHPVFNLTPLSEFSASIIDVRYFDLRGRRARSAAYGDVILKLTKAGV